MRKISAHYVLPVSSPPLKQGIVVLDEMGRVTDLVDTGGHLKETEKLEFYNGVITPGFILPCFLPGPPADPQTAFFTRMDAWLRRSGIRGVGLIQDPGTHFNEKQKSPVHYHTILELNPPENEAFRVFQEAVNTITLAWNEFQQACSISCHPKAWLHSDLPSYLLKYISTHQSILTLRQQKDAPADEQVQALNRAWNLLNEDENPASLPGHLILCGNSISGEQITVPGLKTYCFPLSAELPRDDGTTTLIRELYEMQEDWPGAGLPEVLPRYTTEAARTLFQEDRLGSIAPGTQPGLNLIGGIEYTSDGGMRLKKDSTLSILQL